MIETATFLALGVSYLAIVAYFYILGCFGYSGKNLPPGPRGLPLFGNAFQLMGDLSVILTKWQKKYGKMYTLRLGNNTAVVINDHELVKEVMSDENFSSRPNCEVGEMLSGGPYGIQNGKAWEEQRHWIVENFREFSFSKTSKEDMIMEEVNELTEIIKNHGVCPVKANEFIDLAVLNMLWTLLNGERLPQSDPRVKEVVKTYHHAMQTVTNSGLIFAPWLQYIFPNSKRAVKNAADKLMKICKDVKAEHWDTHKEGVTRDFIDAYICEIKKTCQMTSPFFGSVGRKNLEATICDLIQAGLKTTSSSLSWFLCYITEYPEVQAKVQKEIAQVIGSRGRVQLADKTKLPYVEAAILETLRCSSVSCIGLRRSAVEDKVVNGFLIPKDCWVVPNIHFIHHNTDVWGDPENFRPERFLSKDGTKVVRHEAFIPFQNGTRKCIGEGLAMDTLFLFAANLCKRFKIERLEKEYPQYDNAGTLLVPKEYNFIFKAK